MTNCDTKFRANKHDAPSLLLGRTVRFGCTRPAGHQGRHAASIFYEVKKWGQPLPEGCIRLETLLEPAEHYESRVFDSMVDMVTCKQVWA